MKYKNRIISLILILIMAAFLLPSVALAAGPIETDRDVSLTISYKDGDTPIPDAAFDIYYCADVDMYSRMKLTDDFATYPINIDGLDQNGWQELAVTLKGYAQRDNLTPAVSGTTDSNGEIVLTVKPGLYLVVGSQLTIDDYTYTPSPFMIFLPDSNEIENIWDYDVDSAVKFSKEYNPPEEEVITRKALKIWDDAGFEDSRPQEVTVQLLRNGEVYDTQILNADNNWRYVWEDLSDKYEWTIVEKELEGYTTTVQQEGVTFTITNKYVIPLISVDPPVTKKITGDTPSSASTFTFVLTALDSSNPMPEGSTEMTKEISIKGAGTREFGRIDFTNPGTYTYTISEKDTGIEGYTYDTTLYTVRFTVTEQGGELAIQCTTTETNGNEVDSAVFTNEYKKPTEPALPQTGMTWWPVPLFLCVGLAFYVVGMLWKRKQRDDE